MALLGQEQRNGTLNEQAQESKYKINRRLGVNLWGRPKSPLNRREYGPGQHGQRRKKPSDFGTQLSAKQKLKGYYANIGERQFRRLYEEAVRRRGDTGENLIELLERRLDAVVYRMKLAPTPFAARQLVNHGMCWSTASGSTSLVLQLQRRRHDRAAGEGQADGARPRGVAVRRARRARLSSRSTTSACAAGSSARRSSPMCPFRCRWSPTSSSNSIPAEACLRLIRRQFSRACAPRLVPLRIRPPARILLDRRLTHS